MRFGHSLIPRLKLQNVVCQMMGLHRYWEETISLPILLDAFQNNIGFPVFVVDVVTRGSKKWMECKLFHLCLPLSTLSLHTWLEWQDVFQPSESRWHCVNLDVVRCADVHPWPSTKLSAKDHMWAKSPSQTQIDKLLFRQTSWTSLPGLGLCYIEKISLRVVYGMVDDLHPSHILCSLCHLGVPVRYLPYPSLSWHLWQVQPHQASHTSQLLLWWLPPSSCWIVPYMSWYKTQFEQWMLWGPM